MTVKELILLLKKMDREAEIYIVNPEQKNMYRTLVKAKKLKNTNLKICCLYTK